MNDVIPLEPPKYPSDCKSAGDDAKVVREKPDARFTHPTVDPDKRQESRLPNVNHTKLATIVAWDPRLALDIVLAGVEKAAEVFAKYKVDKDAAALLLQNPVFLKQLEQYRAEVEASGMTYRMKARVLAEDLLPTAYELANDPSYPASVRADMIQWVTKMADLEPKKDIKDLQGGGGFSLQIVFAGSAPPTLVGSSSAVPLEGEAR